MNDRAPRESATREATSRPKVWRPAARIPTPDPKDGFRFRWVRTRMLGEEDVTNVAKKRQEGWEPVSRAECPEVASLIASGGANIEVGGLMLCKMPEELAASRDEYFQNQNDSAMEGVDNHWMKENDPRMPLLAPERRTTVTRNPKR